MVFGRGISFQRVRVVSSVSHYSAGRSNLVMKERLGIVVHSAGFLFAALAVVGSDVGRILAAIMLLASWAIKYVLTGKKGFFPWN